MVKIETNNEINQSAQIQADYEFVIENINTLYF